MTRKEMEQCISLRHEIKAIEDSMKSPKSTYVVVFYKDYRTGKGIPKARQEVDNGEAELKALRDRLNSRKRRLMKKLQAAEKFIDSVEDSQMRGILRMHYINGQTQKDIAAELNYSPARISQKINEFWNGQASSLRKKKSNAI